MSINNRIYKTTDQVASPQFLGKIIELVQMEDFSPHMKDKTEIGKSQHRFTNTKLY